MEHADDDHDHDQDVIGIASNTSTNDIVRRALDAVDIDETDQALEIHLMPLMDELNAQHVVDFLEQHTTAEDAPVVNALTMSYLNFSPRAAEIFGSYFASTAAATRTSLYKVHLIGQLGNDNVATILSGLQQNPSVTEIALCDVGIEGAVGGEHLATLLLNRPNLQELICGNLALGPEAAHALRPALTGNFTLSTLCLFGCQLGNEGAAVIVDSIVAREGHWNGIRYLCLNDNDLSSDCIPHLAQLLYFHHELERLDLGTNPLLFHADDENKTKPFFQAISSLCDDPSTRTMLRRLLLNYCQMPGHAMVALFQAIAGDDKNSLTELEVYDHTPLPQEEERQRLLDIVPQVQNVVALRINLDFTNAAVLSSFSWNSSIQHLYPGEGPHRVEITDGPIFVTMKRNRNLRNANWLLYHQHDQDDETCSNEEPIPALGHGMWAKAIERLAQDNGTGATATYKILCEKLPSSWWLPQGDGATNNSNNNNNNRIDDVAVAENMSMDAAGVDCRQDETCADCVLPFSFWPFTSRRRPDIFLATPPPSSPQVYTRSRAI